MALLNTTGIIGQVMVAGTTTLTGSLEATLLLVLIILFTISLMFRIPLEYFAVILLPFCLAIATETGEFMVPITIIIIYVSTIVAKNWIFK